MDNVMGEDKIRVNIYVTSENIKKKFKSDNNGYFYYTYSYDKMNNFIREIIFSHAEEHIKSYVKEPKNLKDVIKQNRFDENKVKSAFPYLDIEYAKMLNNLYWRKDLYLLIQQFSDYITKNYCMDKSGNEIKNAKESIHSLDANNISREKVRYIINNVNNTKNKSILDIFKAALQEAGGEPSNEEHLVTILFAALYEKSFNKLKEGLERFMNEIWYEQKRVYDNEIKEQEKARRESQKTLKI